MEIYEVLDELEKLVEGGPRIPMTGKVFLDVESILEFIDRIRASMPEEIRQARWLSKERDRLLGEAKDEAEHLLGEAHRHIDSIIADTEVVNKARAKAQEIIQQAQDVAQEIRAEAYTYADEMLGKLETNLDKNLQAIREGRGQIKQSAGKTAV